MKASNIFQLEPGKWFWGAVIPVLPDIGSDHDRVDSSNFIGGYKALAESIANEPPGTVALQIRLNTTGEKNGHLGSITPMVLGRSESIEGATRLWHLARATLPAEIDLRALETKDSLVAAIRHVDFQERRSTLLEVRRRIEELSPYRPDALRYQRESPGVMRWQSELFGLRHTSAVLAQHPCPATVLLHMEPAEPSLDTLEFLDAEVRRLLDEPRELMNPLREQTVNTYRRWLRDLPRAALHIRVGVAAAGPVTAGLPQSIGVELTERESFEIVKPYSTESRRTAEELFTTATANWWGESDEPSIDELLGLADTSEAAQIVRFPTPARGGTPGLPSARITTLPRSAQEQDSLGSLDPRRTTYHLGHAVGGGTTGLSSRELNQHLLVCGLPGFGKTVTVQSLLYRLWTGKERIPFLVLDPAKTDYARLASALGPDARFIELSPTNIAFNPFGVPANSTALSHASRVLAAFDAALRLSSHWPLGYITLARAVYRVYDRFPEGGCAPTLALLRREIELVLKESKFQGSDGANVRASLLGRIDYLSNGPLGNALKGDEKHVIDYAELFSHPTIIQFRGFTGPTERSLIFALLLAGLISYREANPAEGGLCHLTVLEEAHRVLAGGNDASSEGIRLFVEAIAEQRSSGEGYIIVDQAPSLLHPGVSKLAGSVLSHRIVDAAERESVGSAVLLDARQQSDLARLPNGQAILYSADRFSSVVVEIEAVPELLASPKPVDENKIIPRGLPFSAAVSGETADQIIWKQIQQSVLKAAQNRHDHDAVMTFALSRVLEISYTTEQALQYYHECRKIIRNVAFLDDTKQS